MRRLLLMIPLLLAPLAAAASDIPWFNQRAAEQLVAEVEPEYLAYIQERFTKAPDRYADHLHKALVMVAKRADHPELYQAWHRVSHAEMAYIAAADAYRAASPSQQPELVPTLQRLAIEWESAIAHMYAVKIPLTENKLYNLESNLSDLRANFDAYVDDRVLNTTDR